MEPTIQQFMRTTRVTHVLEVREMTDKKPAAKKPAARTRTATNGNGGNGNGGRLTRNVNDDPGDDRRDYRNRDDNGMAALIPLAWLLGLAAMVAVIVFALWAFDVIGDDDNGDGTTVANVDSDGDGFTDAYESSHGSNPNDASSYPGSDNQPTDATGHGNEVNKAPMGGSFNPYPFYSQSCDPQQSADGGCSWDIGTMGSLDFNGGQATQVAVVKGVSISWKDKVAKAFPASNGEPRCSLVVLTPNSFFENLTVKDANVTVYNIWPGDVAGWSKTLGVQAAQEQEADYGCPKKSYDQIEKWGSDIPSPPCGVQGFSNCGSTTQSNTQQQSDDGQQNTDNGVIQSNSAPAPEPAAPAPAAPAEPAPAPTTAPVQQSCDTLDCGSRTATADTGGSASFNSGEAVYGFSITIGGSVYQNCYFSSAPGSGTVVDGVVHPWTAEVANARAC